MAHRCDRLCVCPLHQTPLIYWPAGNDHACQDVDCQYGHGGCNPSIWDVLDRQRRVSVPGQTDTGEGP